MLLEGILEGIQHLAIFTVDLKRSREFYEQFGFREKLATEMPADPEPLKIAFLELNGLTLELAEFSGETRKEIAERRDGHIDHVALNVKDIDKAYAELTAKGFKTIEDPAPVFMDIWEKGTKYFTIQGPDGEKVEFSQIL